MVASCGSHERSEPRKLSRWLRTGIGENRPTWCPTVMLAARECAAPRDLLALAALLLKGRPHEAPQLGLPNCSPPRLYLSTILVILPLFCYSSNYSAVITIPRFFLPAEKRCWQSLKRQAPIPIEGAKITRDRRVQHGREPINSNIATPNMQVGIGVASTRPGVTPGCGWPVCC